MTRVDNRKEFDPVLLEVLWNRLISITEEQAQTLMRVGLTSLLTDAGDLSACLFDSKAKMVAQATVGTPGHFNALATGLFHFLRHNPPETLQPGDVLIGNNSYELSGHMYDITIVTPVFYRGRIVGYFGSTCHVLDIGGRGMTTETASIFEEGLHIPYLKYYKAGQPNLDVQAFITANSREPLKVLGDLRAQVIANSAGAQRLCVTLEEFGLDDIEALTDQITAVSEIGMRRAIAELPDGEYFHSVISDGVDEPIRLCCLVKVKGDQIEVDFTGCAPASRHAINVCLNFTKAYTFFALKSVLAPDIPNNDGSFRPLSIFAPEGSIVNAKFPMPTVARHAVSHFVAECVLGALYKIVPEKVIAQGAGTNWNMIAMGEQADGSLFSSVFFIPGGMGARAEKDGLSTTPFPSGIHGTPIEIMETDAPMIVHQFELRQDSAGPGRQRGGLGQVVRFSIRTGKPWRFPTLFERTEYPANGLAGGSAGALGEVWLNDTERLSAKKGSYNLNADDIVTYKLPGGGGFGPATERDRAAILKDIEEGYVSREAAVRDYGIKI